MVVAGVVVLSIRARKKQAIRAQGRKSLLCCVPSTAAVTKMSSSVPETVEVQTAPWYKCKYTHAPPVTACRMSHDVTALYPFDYHCSTLRARCFGRPSEGKWCKSTL